MYKLVTMGTFCVGKTSLIMQFIEDCFLTEYEATIQDFYSKDTVVDEEQVHLDIVDTTGIEAFCPMRNQAMLWGDGFLLVYAVNDPRSFENVSVFWDNLRRLKGTKRVPVVLVANKIDTTNRLVDPTRGKEMARKLGVPYVETSARTRQGVEQAFYDLLHEIRRIRAEKEPKRLSNTSCCTIQ